MNTSPGSLLLLLLAVYLLLAYFTGRLEWLFSLGRDVNAAYKGAPAAPAAPASNGPAATAYPPRRGANA